MPGGFIGVDVFFVISGFLITTLLLREKAKNGRISLTDFWRRRARRLLPALLTVVCVSIAAAWLVNTDLLVNIARQTLGALTFSTNWVEIFAGTDYFASAEQAIFVTFWSLAVEEQFYLLWPLILVALLRMTKSIFLLTVGASLVAIASAALMAVMFSPAESATRIYYGTDTHCFGLMIGIAVAFASRRETENSSDGMSSTLRALIGFTAMAGLLFLSVYLDSGNPLTYKGGLAAASLLSSCAVAVLPGSDTLFTKACRIPPIAWAGERSYGLYLWHWPALLILESARARFFPETAPWIATVVGIIVTLMLTEASYKWIEMPVRQGGFRETWRRVAGTLRSGSSWVRWPGIATVCSLALTVTACLGLINAPAKTKVQLAVEAGEQMISSQNSIADAPADDAGSASGNGPAWPKEFALPSGDSIAAFGDSVMVGSASALYQKFPGIRIKADFSKQWKDAPGMMQPMLDDGNMRSVVILSYGTNAGFKEPIAEQSLRRILDSLGPHRRVVLVNTVGYSYWVKSANETLNRISADYPNTIVADWWSVANEQPNLLHRDKTHPNEAGIFVYANVIAEALKRLGPG